MSDWRPVSRSNPCPVCHKADYCAVHKDGIVKCMRVQEGSFSQKEDGAGMAFYHNVEGKTFTAYKAPPKKRLSQEWLNLLFERSQQHYRQVIPLSKAIGVPLHTLTALGVGYVKKDTLQKLDTKCPEDGAYTFPMKDQHENIIGYRLRVGDNKYSLKGGRNGLFVPTGIGNPRTLFVVEGPTDCAAMLAYGHECIGRPNNTAGTAMLADYIKKKGPSRVEIVVDNDKGSARVQTLGGAKRLIEACEGVKCRVWSPSSSKDIRQLWEANMSLREGLQEVKQIGDMI